MRVISVSEKDVKPIGDAGPAPMLQWLPISELVVDDSYQRDLKRENWTAIRKIAGSFTWSRFSPVFVAPVEGGLFAIIDGQHRTHAAALRGFERVPCQIVQMSKEEQAQAFAAVNGMVTKVTLWNLYRAELAAGTAWAVTIRQTAVDAGCIVAENNNSTAAKKPGEIYAIDGFRKVVEKFGKDPVTAALQLLMRCDKWSSEAVYWSGDILLPILQVICRRPSLLGRDEFRTAFEAWPLWKHIDEIAEIAKAARRSGTPVPAKRDQLQVRLYDWMQATFPKQRPVPSTPVVVPQPAAAAAPAATLSTAPGMTGEQLRQYQEARKRKARLGF